MKITVNDMTCKMCAAKIEKQLIMNGIKSTVDVSSKTVLINEKDQEKAMLAIKNAGYTPAL